MSFVGLRKVCRNLVFILMYLIVTPAVSISLAYLFPKRTNLNHVYTLESMVVSFLYENSNLNRLKNDRFRVNSLVLLLK